MLEGERAGGRRHRDLGGGTIRRRSRQDLVVVASWHGQGLMRGEAAEAETSDGCHRPALGSVVACRRLRSENTGDDAVTLVLAENQQPRHTRC